MYENIIHFFHFLKTSFTLKYLGETLTKLSSLKFVTQLCHLKTPLKALWYA